MDQPELSAPRVRELVEALHEQRRQHTAILAGVERAEGELRDADAELQNLRTRIAEKEAELARSGAPIPDSGFGEDAQLARAERQRRVLALRLEVPRKKAQQRMAEIVMLKSEIDAAWREFGKVEHHKALLAFGQAAAALAEQYRDLVVWNNIFRALSLPVPEVVVEDVLTHGIFINTQDVVWHRKNQPEQRDLYATLSAVRAEIEQAKGK
ncbi:MAG: hypothetical protein WCB12_13000 [Bryobacteraceae bacterium]